jgi:hypothetical protein
MRTQSLAPSSHSVHGLAPPFRRIRPLTAIVGAVDVQALDHGAIAAARGLTNCSPRDLMSECGGVIGAEDGLCEEFIPVTVRRSG